MQLFAMLLSLAWVINHFRRFAPLKKIKMQSCQHDIAKSILALGFKLLEN